MNNAAAIASFRTAQLSIEAEIASVNPAAFVLMWNGAVLRTDGQRVSICGTSVYNDARKSFMVREAAKFTQTARQRMADVAPVTVHTAAEALEIVKAEGAKLWGVIQAANA